MTPPSTPPPETPEPPESQPVLLELDDESGGGRPRSLAGEVAAWGVILLIVAGLPLWQWWKQERQPAAAPQPVYERPDIGFVVLSRYAVGSDALLKRLGQPNPAQSAQLLARLEQAADNPAERLRAAVVAAEFGEPGEALTRLDGVLDEVLDERNRNDAELLRRHYERIGERPGATESPNTSTQRGDDVELQERLGWFGQLAASHAQPDGAAREEAMRRAVRTAVFGMALGFSVIVVGLAALAALVLVIVFMSTGRLSRAYHPAAPRAAPAGVFVEGFALYLLAHLGLGYGAYRVSPWLGLWSFLLGFLVLPAVVAGLKGRGVTWGEIKYGLGWHAGRGWWREIGAGALGYLAGIPLVVVAALITAGLSRFAGGPAEHPIIDWVQSPSPWVPLQLYLIACVLAPVVEELMFRGVFYHYLRGRFGFLVSAVAVAFVFAALHPQGWMGVPVLMTLAVVFAAMREWRGSIIAPVVAHAVNNGVATTVLLVMTR